MLIVQKTVCRTDCPAVGIGKVQIYGGGADAAMPQKLFDGKQVGSVLQQMGGKLMTQAVYRGVLVDASDPQPLLHRQLDRISCHVRQVPPTGKE